MLQLFLTSKFQNNRADPKQSVLFLKLAPLFQFKNLKWFSEQNSPKTHFTQCVIYKTQLFSTTTTEALTRILCRSPWLCNRSKRPATETKVQVLTAPTCRWQSRKAEQAGPT